jgi:L-amino acid N-acyltransferase YncA/metal-sulfur cluster biosynthetic enzyme
LKPAKIRTADPDRDAAACVAVYAPYVEAGATSFEEEPPSPAEFAERIAAMAETYPWLVAERGGEVVGYAYACPHRSRPAYRWAVEVSVYVAEGQRRGGCGRALYGELAERLRKQGFHVACAGITCRTRPVSPSTRAWDSSRSGSTGGSAGRTAPGGTSAGGSLSWRRQATARRQSRSRPRTSPGYHWPMPENQTEVLTEDDVIEALEEVIDPELGLDFVSLGLVYDVEIEKEDVYVTFTLTTPACPIGPQVSEQMKEFVGDLPGVSAVHPKMVFDPPWSPEMMTEDAKFALGF